MSRSNLVIARAGRNSLHASWFDPAESRDWDLFLCPYQPLLPQTPAFDGTVGNVIPGAKWAGLRVLLNEWPDWRQYERIWLPDDDIFTSQDNIGRMFEAADALGFDLCAPALHEASYYAHYSTMRNRRCFARRINFVEIMAPCFSRAALERLLPTLELSSTGWGWGLDSLWPKLLDYRNTGIIDATPVLHTRPVGAFRDPDLDLRVHQESDRIMNDYACRQVHTTTDVIGPELQSLALSPEAMTATLVDGWRYLFDANPSVLPWIVEAQKPPCGWGDYPIEGTPASATAGETGVSPPARARQLPVAALHP